MKIFHLPTGYNESNYPDNLDWITSSDFIYRSTTQKNMLHIFLAHKSIDRAVYEDFLSILPYFNARYCNFLFCISRFL